MISDCLKAQPYLYPAPSPHLGMDEALPRSVEPGGPQRRRSTSSTLVEDERSEQRWGDLQFDSLVEVLAHLLHLPASIRPSRESSFKAKEKGLPAFPGRP